MVPPNRWLRAELRDLMEDLLSPERVRVRGLFAPEAVDALKREYQSRTRSHGDRLWCLVVAELWAQQYLDAKSGWTFR